MKIKQSSLRLREVFKFLTIFVSFRANLWSSDFWELLILCKFFLKIKPNVFFRKNSPKCVLLQLMLSADSSAAISQDIGSELERWREKREDSRSIYFFWKSFWGKDQVTIFVNVVSLCVKDVASFVPPLNITGNPEELFQICFWYNG